MNNIKPKERSERVIIFNIINIYFLNQLYRLQTEIVIT
jgi:hypothetical protein